MKEGAKNHEEFNVIGTVILDGDRKRIAFKSATYYNQCVARLPAGKEVTVTISTKKYTRSEAQRKYHWELMKLIADHTGNTPDEMHEIVMVAVFGTKEITVRGKTYTVRRSFSNAAGMKKYEAVEAINYDLQLAADLGVHVPTPEELGYYS